MLRGQRCGAGFSLPGRDSSRPLSRGPSSADTSVGAARKSVSMGLRPIHKDENPREVQYTSLAWERRGRARTGAVEAVRVFDPERPNESMNVKAALPRKGKRG